MHLRRRTRLVAATAAILAATTASCSTSDSKSEAAAACESPGVTSDQVKFGLVFSDSGAGNQALSSARAGVDARIGLANQEGGVNGRRLVYEWRDDAASPSQNAKVVDELVNQESVFGVVAVTTSASGSVESLGSAGIPVVGLADATWKIHPNMFSYSYETSPQIIGRYLQLNGGTKVAFVTTGSSASAVRYTERYASAMRAMGLTVVGTASYSSGDSPVRVAQQLADSGANVLVGLTTPNDIASIMHAARTINASFAATVSLAGYDRGVLSTLGTDLAGVSFPVYFRPFEAGGPAIDHYRNAITQFAPELVMPEQQFAMYGYIYADLFIRGLQKAGACPTRESFIRGLRTVTGYDAGGLIEPVDLATNINKPLDCSAFVQVDPTGRTFQVTQERLCADGTGS
ncbi:putative Leu/Ile/Val-binding lipoprotein transmembrane [Parafrankia sp. EAN1pec]|uniref:ABC transporter substrate-binding protein n=1 Tax=Parafrankia sp. (strain EAN1pec) TaxID=298653 RepID=UPI0000541CC0|nr:putative Leu/Ile/Val-binding lipoprotein transmembrane [Frankia sp. EAN1pec]